MVCLLAAPRVQLSVSACNGWPHNYHYLISHRRFPLSSKPSFSQNPSLHSHLSLAQAHIKFDHLAVTGGGSVGECGRLSQLSWLLGILWLWYSYIYLLTYYEWYSMVRRPPPRFLLPSTVWKLGRTRVNFQSPNYCLPLWLCEFASYKELNNIASFLTRTWLRYVRVFAIPNPSVVCRFSVGCNVRAPYSRGWNFRQYYFAVLVPLTTVQNFTENVTGEPLRRRR